jgi:hypothetical protein
LNGRAAGTVPGAVWTGEATGGLPLVRAEQQSLKAPFVRDSRPAQTGAGLELAYGTLTRTGRLDRSRPFVQINEAPNAVLAFGIAWAFVRGRPA